MHFYFLLKKKKKSTIWNKKKKRTFTQICHQGLWLLQFYVLKNSHNLTIQYLHGRKNYKATLMCADDATCIMLSKALSTLLEMFYFKYSSLADFKGIYLNSSTSLMKEG